MNDDEKLRPRWVTEPLPRLKIRTTGKTGRGRLLPQWPDYLDAEEEWKNANNSLCFGRILWDDYEELLSRVLERAVARGWLDGAESWLLLELFRDGKPASHGRPHASPEDQARARWMSTYSFMLEAAGLQTKAAIADTMKTFGVKSRTSVTEARRQWGPKIPQELRDRWRDDPEWRESQREFAEELAGWFRAGKPEREKTKCESK